MVLPAGPASDHGVEYGQQLAHAGDQRNLFRLTGRNKSDIERPDRRVKLDGGDHRHIQHAAHAGPAAENCAPAAHFS